MPRAEVATLHALTICAALSSFGPRVAAQAPALGQTFSDRLLSQSLTFELNCKLWQPLQPAHQLGGLKAAHVLTHIPCRFSCASSHCCLRACRSCSIMQRFRFTSNSRDQWCKLQQVSKFWRCQLVSKQQSTRLGAVSCHQWSRVPGS